MAEGSVLVINCGSSSVKFALFDDAREMPRRLASGVVERIGLDGARAALRNANNEVIEDEHHDIPNHVAAIDLLLTRMERLAPEQPIAAVGHRVVHGGEDCDCPLFVTPALEARLKKLVPLAPLHLPHNVAGIRAVRERRPDLLQVACFDTAFHRDLPRLARLTGLPRRLADAGIRRFGFHGLSYEYVLDDLIRRAGPEAAAGRIVVAHLGNGASMAAIMDGRSVETTMGFSTLAGLPMGTRSGDIDPGAILYLLKERDLSPAELESILYEQSGLLGLSGISRNMEELLGRRADSPAAAEAVGFFCYQARKHLAALTATLGGLDRLIFTGGIGANAPEIRSAICDGLAYLGIEVDEQCNSSGRQRISRDGSRILVEAVPTDEEQMIARHVQRLLVEHRVAEEPAQ